MARLLVAGPARLDVREILTRLTEAAGYPVARRYGARFKAMYRYIAQYQPFVMIYAYDGQEITILRVVDGRREITRQLLGH
jgi:plasmid stabilization system protein ParE